MSERGVFAVDRGIFDHPLFAPEPYTEREAWLWLISAAAWKAKRVRVGRTMVDLTRGQLAFSERFFAQKWQWAKTTVRRFLARIKSEAMILTQKSGPQNGPEADRFCTIITICNYERYAFDGSAKGPQNGPEAGPEADQKRTKEEEGKKDKKEKTWAIAKATPPKYSDEFEELWKVYPSRLGPNPKNPAANLFLAAVKAGADPQQIIVGAKRCAVVEARNIGTPFIPQLVKWLRDKRWFDYGLESTAVIPFNIRNHLV